MKTVALSAMPHRWSICLSVCLALATSSVSWAQVSKGHQILIDNGLQIQGMVNVGDTFHLTTYQNLNYTAINWLWDANHALNGAEPGTMPWARWVRPGANPPTTAEMPPLNGEALYMSKLLALSLGDEPNLNDSAVRDAYVSWFNAVQTDPAYANVILYMNNYGGQVTDVPLGDFISRAHPDMISFDTYPYRFAAPNDATRVQPLGGSPTNWYGDLRRYREHAKGNNIPLGVYRQTYHSITEGVRDASESELRLMTFASLAYNAKYLTDFTYNTGASSFFTNAAGGDNAPNALYAQAQQINHEARNLGKALVRLTPIADQSFPDLRTTSVMIIRGKHTNNTTLNALPIGFAPDTTVASNIYSEWTFGLNDPYISGPFNDAGTNNQGSLNGGFDGDVIISWFKPLDESFDGPAFNDERYIMVTNGLADLDGTAAQTAQQVKLNFGSSSVKFPYDHLQKLDRNTGLIVNVPLNQLTTNVWQLDIVIPGGTSELFKFPTGAPFVGVPEPGTIAMLPLVSLLLRRVRGH